MNPDQGFADLRLNRQGGQTEEGFWPSFTDIMTVVVMIFLLAMVVLLIRNMELMDQLRATMNAEREAATLARLTGEQKDTLAVRLHTAMNQLVLLQKQLNHLEAQNEQQEAAIASQSHQLAAAEKERNRLQGQGEQQQALLQARQQDLDEAQTARNTLLSQFTGERNALSALRKIHDDTSAELLASRRDVQDLQARLQASRNEKSELELRLNQTQKKLGQLGAARDKLLIVHDNALDELQQARQRAGDAEAELEQVLAGQAVMLRDQEHLKSKQEASAAALAAARKKAEEMHLRLEIQEQALTQAMARLEQADLSLSGMQEEYSSLKLKYDDLIKPARSAEGRYLVEVRVSKEDDRLITRFRESREAKFDIMERPVLERRLSELQDLHKNGLYIRVIIPEDSGLSYNEAWSFTSGIHGKFDYYYQGQRDTQ